MAINPIQPNIENTKTHKPYREATGAVRTEDCVKPLRPEGHLVNDTVLSVPQYFIKDIAYDIKAVKDGFSGNANDHQLGRLNDVGLKLGGVGIATLLASRTSNPMARLMEYVGLGAFLTAMTMYPKIAINAPSRVIQGFDIGKEYIDDQGRKKSVFQDPNYIPYDMYQGDYPGEDLDLIGDKMGIPRNIKNRHEIIKEQTRKIANQNNTLWMLTAGAVPVYAALLCYGLERTIAPGLENLRNAKYNSKISHMLNKTNSMTENISEISSNSLSRNIEKILEKYQSKELPKAEYDKIIELLTRDMDYVVAEGIKKDVDNIIGKANGVRYNINSDTAKNILESIKNNIPSRNKAALEKIFVLTQSEIENIIPTSGSKQLTEEEIFTLKNKFNSLFDAKIANETNIPKEFLNAYKNEVIESLTKEIKKTPSKLILEGETKDIVNLAKILGEFKENAKSLDKCKSFKVEYAPQTVLARSYEEFEKTLFKVLDIKYKDLKRMRMSEKFAQEILEKKLNKLVKDEAKYQDAIEKLTKVMSKMEVKLNGSDEAGSHLKDLITGIENNYNNTAKRLNRLGRFSHTIDGLVKEDISTLSNTLETREQLFDFLDGTLKDKYAGKDYWGLDDKGRYDYAKHNSKGVGSAKNHDISRIVDRYQGAKNSFNRILHLFDVFKRPIDGSKFDVEVLAKGKDALLNASSSDHTLKLNTINNPEYYKEIMRKIWSTNLQNETQNGLNISTDIASGNVEGRFKKYIQRFQDIIGNNSIDFTKPEHILDANKGKEYTKSSVTRMSKFNLIAQSPVDMVLKGADKHYGNQKWLRIASAIGASVLGVAFLAQFGFGKIRNPHNIQKQVVDDANN